MRCENGFFKKKNGRGGSGKFYHVAHQKTVAVEMDQVRALELVHDGGDHLAARAGDRSDVLVRERVFHERFKTDGTTGEVRAVAQKIDDPGSGIFDNEVFELFFSIAEAPADEFEDRAAEPEIALHDLLDFLDRKRQIARFVLQSGGTIGPSRFASEAKFAKNAARLDDRFDDLSAKCGRGEYLDRSIQQDKNLFGRLGCRVNRIIFGGGFSGGRTCEVIELCWAEAGKKRNLGQKCGQSERLRGGAIGCDSGHGQQFFVKNRFGKIVCGQDKLR